MSKDPAFRRLHEMSALVLDARSAGLARAAAARDAIRKQLDDLNSPLQPDVVDPVLHAASWAYEGWAAARRAELGIQLAARQAEWLELQAQARKAFARQQVLDKVASQNVKIGPRE